MTTTTKLGDYLGRALKNDNPGNSNATDYLGRAVGATNTDFIGRALVNTPSYPPANIARSTAYALGAAGRVPGIKRVETATVTGTPTGNAKFAVTKDGQTLTATVAYGTISAANIQAAVVALANVDPGDVTVAGSGPYTFTWEDELGNGPSVAADNSGLSGGTIAVVQTTAGNARGQILQVTTAGTTHASNLITPPAVGATVTDGTVTWKRTK